TGSRSGPIPGESSRGALQAGLREHVPAHLGGVAPRGERPRAVALLALAAGEVEVALELARLACDLRAPEHEAVRVEERAEVDVGEDACRRRVACALEAVQLERDERVDRSDLVDDEQRPAGPADAHELREHELGPRDVV